MKKVASKEDCILQFCYEADIGDFSSFEDLQRRMRWNYDTKWLQETNHAQATFTQQTDFGPFGDHGYIFPFLDFSAFVNLPCKERIFVAGQKKSLFTRYFTAASGGRLYVSSSGHYQGGTSAGSNNNKTDNLLDSSSDSAWLNSAIDHALLELEDLVEWERSSRCPDKCFDQTKSFLGNAEDANRSDAWCDDYEHFPWPWIDLPPSKTSVDWELSGWLGRKRQSGDDDGGSDPTKDGEDSLLELNDNSLLQSPLHHSSPLAPSTDRLNASRSTLTSIGGGEESFCCPCSGNNSSGSTTNSSVNLTLEMRPIPVLSPLGLHRAQGGERILSGAGVDHMNLIQLIGNPAHEFQPTLSHLRWRNVHVQGFQRVSYNCERRLNK